MKIVLVLIFLSSFSTYGKEKPLFLSDVTRSSTSDNLELTTFHVKYNHHRRNIFWPYENEDIKAYDFGVDLKYFDGKYSASSFSGFYGALLFGRKFDSSKLVEASIGVHSLADRSTIIPWSVKFSKMHSLVQTTVKFNYNYIYQNLSLPAGIESEIKAKESVIKLIVTPKKYFRIPLRYANINYSDENSKNNSSLDVLFGSSYPVWFWVGLGAEYISNTKPMSGYWTPSWMRSIGFRSEITYTILPKLDISGGFNLNRFKESGLDSGMGSYSTAAIKYGDRNIYQVGINFIYIDSKQGSNDWDQTDVKLFYNKSF